MFSIQDPREINISIYSMLDVNGNLSSLPTGRASIFLIFSKLTSTQFLIIFTFFVIRQRPLHAREILKTQLYFYG